MTERLLIYPPKDARSREKSVLLLLFGLAAFFVGLFSVTRLFLIHWVWLVPLSLGSLVLFMVAVLYFRIREKPLEALWLEKDGLFLLPDPGSPESTAVRYPLSEIRVEKEGQGLPTTMRIYHGDTLLLSFSLVQVRDVTLYGEIARLLETPSDTFSTSSSVSPAKMAGKGKFFWVILPWSLIVLLMAAWEIYESHLAPRNYGPFSNP